MKDHDEKPPRTKREALIDKSLLASDPSLSPHEHALGHEANFIVGRVCDCTPDMQNKRVRCPYCDAVHRSYLAQLRREREIAVGHAHEAGEGCDDDLEAKWLARVASLDADLARWADKKPPGRDDAKKVLDTMRAVGVPSEEAG